ncbi:exodeoxyribonuclease VII large subunit, partial [Slackia isoflavoniconvertens]|uniref:exodeoxyribonuclease VII large subunit n=2 Tax=Slackia TaxID=84108 RepID=UPI003AF04F89
MLASQVEQQQGDDEKKPLSISEALDVAKGSLEKLKLRVLGEVSEVNVKPGYANAYFTLKDETGTLPCQMWHDRFEKCGITLEVGMMVELVGRFSLYPKKGRMHFQVFAISVAGEGMLRQQVAMLQRKLEAEGLMAPERKVPVPAYPMKIGVVTSPRGDAIHDVLRTTRRRFPLAHIYVAGVPVEGARAPEYIVEGMRACFRARVEVILLVRGGGSYEDLMPFNDEQLARAIVKCPIPVVTGIGHEPDTTIADLVGDLRASTPTGAAEAVTVQTSQLAAQLRSTGAHIAQRQQQRIQHATLSLDRYATRPIFKDP